MKNLSWKYVNVVCFLPVVFIVITSCEKRTEDREPCENRKPAITGTNTLAFLNVYDDTLQYINLEDSAVLSLGTAYYSSYHSTANSDKTFIEILYNTYENSDPEFYQVVPLFNGATRFEIHISIVDSTLNNQYEIDELSINFHNGYYALYKFIKDTNTTVTISKYGEVFDKIEGDFMSTFVNTHNNSDSLNFHCQFSVVRWCDI